MSRSNYVWTAERNEFILQNADKMKDKDIAAALTARYGRPFSVASVRQHRRLLNLKKRGGRGKYDLKINKLENSHKNDVV